MMYVYIFVILIALIGGNYWLTEFKEKLRIDRETAAIKKRIQQRQESNDQLRASQYKAMMMHRQTMTKHVSQRKENAIGRSLINWDTESAGK